MTLRLLERRSLRELIPAAFASSSLRAGVKLVGVSDYWEVAVRPSSFYANELLKGRCEDWRGAKRSHRLTVM